MVMEHGVVGVVEKKRLNSIEMRSMCGVILNETSEK